MIRINLFLFCEDKVLHFGLMADLELNEVPGFVDLQINGYKGVDFSSKSLTMESFEKACLDLINNGTIAFLPTIITSPTDVYKHVIPIIVNTINNINNNNLHHHILGIHLEGPFISNKPGAVGAHPAKYTLDPDIKFLSDLIELSQNNIRLITIAPELPNSRQFIEYANRNNIIISLGHSLANYDEMMKSTKSGAKLLTHLGNGIPSLINRHDNLFLNGLCIDDLKAGIICDGYHLPLQVIKLIIKTKGYNNIILVSDLSPPAGLKNGIYNQFLGGIEIAVNGQHVYQAKDTKYLAGSGSTLYQCVQYLIRNTNYDIKYIYQMSVINPLRLLGYDDMNIMQFIEKHQKIRCKKRLSPNTDVKCTRMGSKL